MEGGYFFKCLSKWRITTACCSRPPGAGPALRFAARRPQKRGVMRAHRFRPSFDVQLKSPHIPLGLDLNEGLALIRTVGSEFIDESDGEYCFRAESSSLRVAIYPEANKVGSVWYDDPVGRELESGRMEKLRLYLERYGNLSRWELRMDNGWMHYWFNPADHAAMVYGVHNDVIRFNRYEEEHA